MLLSGGGDVARGEAMLLYPLPLAELELFLMRLPPFWSLLFLIVLMSDACAGLK